MASHAISTLELWGGRENMKSAAAPLLFLAFAFCETVSLAGWLCALLSLCLPSPGFLEYVAVTTGQVGLLKMCSCVL